MSARFQPRIMVRSILKRFVAWSAWLTLAGMMTDRPALRRRGWPPILISASPSNICTKASKGAVCSLSPCPWSKEKRVMLPTSFLSTCLLMIPPSEYSTDADMSRTVALGYVSFVIVCFRLFSLISCLVNGHGITLIASERPCMRRGCAKRKYFVAHPLFLAFGKPVSLSPQRKESVGETWFVRKHIRERTPWLPVSVCT